MITLSAEVAGRALGVDPLATPVMGVSIDSRTLKAGDLFVALRGERFDGHAYVQAAFACGASGAVVETSSLVGHAASSGRVYQVKDTLEALGALAREVRRASGATVFAITGSAGKTSTKDLLKAMVGRARNVVGTSGNQNNEVGVPLTLLGLEPDSEAVVVEMGMRGRGQIAHLAGVAEPDVGVITNVHPVHLELLGSLEHIAQAKAELALGVRLGGTAVVPASCAILEPLLAECRCRIVRFGVGEESDADVRGWLEPSGDGGAHMLALRWPEGQTRVACGHLPDYAVENAVAAAAACYAAGLSVENCATGLAEATLTEGRGQIRELGGICVIDDTYNSNPAAAAAAIDHLVRLAAARKGRAVAVLGDMLELGPQTESFHQELGATAAQAGVSALWGVGPLSEATVRGFRLWWQQNGRQGQEWGGTHVRSSDNVGELISGLRAGDVVLFKASRGVRLEKVVRRMVDEVTAERLRGAPPQVEVDGDGTWEERGC